LTNWLAVEIFGVLAGIYIRAVSKRLKLKIEKLPDISKHAG
jgi:hypothetical protein